VTSAGADAAGEEEDAAAAVDAGIWIVTRIA
jgi:hypothetical protein